MERTIETTQNNFEPSSEDLEMIEKEFGDLLDNDPTLHSNHIKGTPLPYILKISDQKNLTHEEVVELAKRKDSGDIVAKNILIESNLLLVVKIAKRYNYSDYYDEDDLIQEGNYGLIKGVEKYNYVLGYRISTYLTWWIRQAISRYVDNMSHTIRLPSYKNQELYKIFRTESEYYNKTGKNATLSEISQMTGISEEEIKHLKTVTRYISLSSKINDNEDDDELIDFIASDTPDPLNECQQIYLRENLSEALTKYIGNEKMIYVLKRRFGLDGSCPATLTEIAKELGLTRERIRQIEESALKRLKSNPLFKEQFSDF